MEEVIPAVGIFEENIFSSTKALGFRSYVTDEVNIRV